MGLLNPHLDDDDFADVWSVRTALGEAESDRPAEGHLRRCAECRTRYASFAGWLETLHQDAHAEADEIFNRERLAAQQSQILRRLEALDHPARVIAFPKFARPVAVPSGHGRRWIAAAAMVGLVTGVGLGQLLELRQEARSQALAVQRPVLVTAATPAAVEPISHLNDEAFVTGPEVATSQVPVPESLQYLNAITPSARDFDR